MIQFKLDGKFQNKNLYLIYTILDYFNNLINYLIKKIAIWIIKITNYNLNNIIKLSY